MEKIKISMNIPKDVLDRIDGLAERAEIDRTRLMVNMIDEFSKSLVACEKVGVLQFALLMRNISEQMGDWAKTVKSKKVEPL